MKKYHCLYQIVNTINGMIYIGIHSTNKLFDNYMGGGIALNKVYKEFGKENFIKYIIGLYDSKYDAITAEIKIVNKEFVLRKDTYNIYTGGGINPSGVSEETKQIMSQRRLGMIFSDTHKENIKKSWQSRPREFSEETKQKMSESGKKKNPVSEETKEKLKQIQLSHEVQEKRSHTFQKKRLLNIWDFYYDNLINPEKYIKIKKKRMPYSDEARKNMSNAALNKPPMTKETKKKISEANKMKPPVSEETKQKLSKAASKPRPNRKNIPLSKSAKHNLKLYHQKRRLIKIWENINFLDYVFHEK